MAPHVTLVLQLLAVIAQQSSGPIDPAGTPAVVLPASGFAYDGWLSGRVPLDETQIARAASLGARLARLDVDFGELVWSDGAPDDAALSRLEAMVAICRRHGLGVVLSCKLPARPEDFGRDREVRAALGEMLVSLAGRLGKGNGLVGLVPLEAPGAVLPSASLYADFCSWVATRIREADPELQLYLAPWEGGSPANTPSVSYPTVGALCRLPLEASAEERARSIADARTWAAQSGRPLLVDGVVTPSGMAAEQRDALLAATFTALNDPSGPLAFVYDRYRVAGASDGVALSYAADGRFVIDEGLAKMLTTAFAGGPGPALAPPAAPPTS